MTEETIERPICPGCGEPMIWSFCIAYNEYVCIPCGIAKPMMNGLPKIQTTEKAEKLLKEKYEDDIQLLAFTEGHAGCCKCNKHGGNNCPTCKLPTEFKYWKKGNVQLQTDRNKIEKKKKESSGIPLSIRNSMC